MTCDLSKVKERFEKDVFATETTGIEIVDVGECYAKCMLYLKPKHLNAMGAVMGGVIYTLADFAFAVAANIGTGDNRVVSQHMSISFLSPAKGNTLIAVAKCLKAGRRTCLYEITVTDELGTMVAYTTANGFTV